MPYPEETRDEFEARMAPIRRKELQTMADDASPYAGDELDPQSASNPRSAPSAAKKPSASRRKTTKKG